MTDRELMQQALEALESAKYGMAECRQEIGFDFANEQYDVEQAITALRERLAQPEQDGTCSHCAGAGCVACDARHLPKQEPTWRTPGGIPRFKPKQPEQEPVAWTPQVWRQFRPDGTLEFQKIKRTPNGAWEDYTTPPPPRREWVGLTDTDIEKVWADENLGRYATSYAIEAKLKEKNA